MATTAPDTTTDDDVWDIPQPAGPNDPYKVASSLGVATPAANSNAATLGVPAAYKTYAPPIDRSQPPLVAPLQGDPNDHRMIPWERARLLIERGEGTSGDQNIWNYKHAERPDYYTAGGPFQIVDSTWREGGQLAGIDVSQWQHAIDAPKEVQDAVAHALYDRYGFKPWTKQAGGSLNPDGTVASPGGGGGGGMPTFEEYRRRALAGLPPAYDPTGAIEQMRLLNEQQRQAQQPLIDARLKRMREDEEEADRQYGDLKHDLDDPALKPWTMKPPQPDPIGGLASLGAVFAALASRFSHTPGIAAMNGMAAAIEARDAGNQKQYEEAFKAYQYNSQLALRRNEIVQERYNAAWKRLEEDPILGEAELKSIAQIYGDEKSEVLFEAGQYEKAWELSRQRDETATKIAQEQQKLDQFNMFGPTAGTPERQVFETRWRELVREGWDPGAAKDQANRESIQRTKESKPQTPAQAAEENYKAIAIGRYTAAYGHPPSEEEQRSDPNFARMLIDARNTKTIQGQQLEDIKADLRKADPKASEGELDRKADALLAESKRMQSTSPKTAAFLAAKQKHLDEGDDQTTAIMKAYADIAAFGGAAPPDKDTIDLAATSYLETGVMPSLGFGSSGVRTQILERASAIAKDRGWSPEDVLAVRSGVKADQMTLTALTKLRGQIEGFEGLAEKEMGLVKTLMVKGSAPGGIPVINRWLQAGRAEIQGDPDVNAFNAAIVSFKNEYVRIMSSAGAGNAVTSDAARAEGDRLINGAMNRESLVKVMATMQQGMDNRKDAMNQEIAETDARLRNIGKPPAPASTPAAAQPGVIDYDNQGNPITPKAAQTAP